MGSLGFFGLAALFEIAGCFAFWTWLKQGRSPFLAILGVLSLILFALCLARVNAAYAGRAFAAYGGIYIAASVAWFRFVEGGRPDRWDVIGAAVSVLGAFIIVYTHRK